MSVKRPRKSYKLVDPDCNVDVSRATRWRRKKRLANLDTMHEVDQHREHTSDSDVSPRPSTSASTNATPLEGTNNDNSDETESSVTSVLADETLMFFNEDSVENAHNDQFLDSDFTENQAEHFAENISPNPNFDILSPLEEIIFESSGISGNDLQLMLVSLALRHSLTKQSIKDIIILLETCAGRKIPVTDYTINKAFTVPDNVVQYTFYCSQCQNGLIEAKQKSEIKNQNILCVSCQSNNLISLKSEKYFLTIDLQYQFKTFLENSEIQYLLDEHQKKSSDTSLDNDNMADIHDANLYKSLKTKGYDLTFNWNTDGAPVFISSKCSMWPVQLIINELPPTQRFRRVILAGIWYDKMEPNMNSYLKYFAMNIQKLANEGVTWYKNGVAHTSKITALCCCVDSIARPMILNSTQFNGFYGCSLCVHPGQVVNKVVKYPVQQNSHPIRTNAEIFSDMKMAHECNKRIKGIKGPSALLTIPDHDLVWGAPVDYMHSVLLGVVKQLFDIWTTYNYHETNDFYIGSKKTLQEIDKRLTTIKPPFEIHRTPRSLSEWAKWKASERRSWLLFYAVPCLHHILKSKYLEHLILLQKILFILLQATISENDFSRCKRYIIDFVKGFQDFYGTSAMTFNVHLVSHLLDSVKNTGPLWATSAFCFESNMGKYKDYVTGPTGVKVQIVSKALKYDLLDNVLNNGKSSQTCIKFHNSISRHKVCSINDTFQKVLCLGKFIEAFVDGNPVEVYMRLLINNTVFNTKEYSDSSVKNDNSFVKLKDNSYGQILHIYKWKNNKITIKVNKVVCKPFSIKNISMEKCYEIITFTELDNHIDIQFIDCKSVYMKISEDKAFMADFPNLVEIQ